MDEFCTPSGCGPLRNLTPEQEYVLRQHGTERPGTSALLHETRTGTYHCAGCGKALFESGTKFESHCGWPSFYAAIPDATEVTEDRTHGMVRTEVHCADCKGHMGHVFPDGPRPTGLRYCINGIVLDFEPAKAAE